MLNVVKGRSNTKKLMPNISSAGGGPSSGMVGTKSSISVLAKNVRA